MDNQISENHVLLHEANIINSMVDNKSITREQAGNIPGNLEVDEFGRNIWESVFKTTLFVELPEERLEGENRGTVLKRILLEERDGKSVLKLLQENNITLSIAVHDGYELDTDFKESLMLLNEYGILPTLWIVLPDEKGYWTNPGNVIDSMNKTLNVILWAKNNEIKFNRIGLDFEPPYNILKYAMSLDIKHFISGINSLFLEAKKSMADMQQQKKILQRSGYKNSQDYINFFALYLMKQYGIKIETYVPVKQLKKITDTVLLREPDGSFIVPMAYASAVLRTAKGSFESHKRINRVLSGIDLDKESPAIGINGSDPMKTPGRDLEKPPVRHLTPDELRENFAYLLTRNSPKEKYYPFKEIYIFAFDGIDNLQDTILRAKQIAFEEDKKK